MGFFDKLAFWKKDDDPFDLGDFGKDFGSAPASNSTAQSDFGQSYGQQSSYGSPSYGQQSFGNPAASSFASHSDLALNSQTPASSSAGKDRDIDLIVSKLDGIKAQLDSISQRLATVERVALQEEKDEQRRQRGW